VKPSLVLCDGCGSYLPHVGIALPDETHVTSAECFTLYGELLAMTYGDAELRGSLQLLVDAWNAQHPFENYDRKADQSLALHLMTLFLFFEEGVSPEFGAELHGSMMVNRIAFDHLPPPSFRGAFTVEDAFEQFGTPAYHTVLRDWAGEVWSAWAAEYYDVVEEWVRHWRLSSRSKNF